MNNEQLMSTIISLHYRGYALPDPKNPIYLDKLYQEVKEKFDRVIFAKNYDNHFRCNGHITLGLMDGSNNQFKEALIYLISSDRGELTPLKIDCSSRKDYAEIEKMINEDCGGKLVDSTKQGQKQFVRFYKNQ